MSYKTLIYKTVLSLLLRLVPFTSFTPVSVCGCPDRPISILIQLASFWKSSRMTRWWYQPWNSVNFGWFPHGLRSMFNLCNHHLHINRFHWILHPYLVDTSPTMFFSAKMVHTTQSGTPPSKQQSLLQRPNNLPQCISHKMKEIN